MGSEVILVVYAVMGFLSLYAFKAISNSSSAGSSQAPGSNPLEDSKDITTKVDPLTFAFKLLFMAVFLFSLLGMAKAGIESYDYCYLTVANSTLNGSLTTYEYARNCFTNTNTEDVRAYKLAYLVLIIAGMLLFIGFFWEGFLWLKNNVLIRVKNYFVKRR